MTKPATISESGAWFAARAVRMACHAYMQAREAENRRKHDQSISAETRRRCWWAPWRYYTYPEAVRRVTPPALRWADIKATSGRADDQRVGALFSLAIAAENAGSPVWLTAGEALMLPRLGK